MFDSENFCLILNLYTLHTLVETFKILKYQAPVSLHKLLNINKVSFHHQITLPKVKLEISRKNFIFKSSFIWNLLIPKILLVPELDPILKYIIPGSCTNSDVTCTIGFVKRKAKTHLLQVQNSGDRLEWMSDDSNFIP